MQREREREREWEREREREREENTSDNANPSVYVQAFTVYSVIIKTLPWAAHMMYFVIKSCCLCG